MLNHMHGILQIKFQENGRKNPFENGSVGMGLVPILNEQDESLETGNNHVDERNTSVLKFGDKIHAIPSENDISASERIGSRPIPTPLYEIIGIFKSLTQNEYADHVRNNGWPTFMKRLWQCRFYDHIIRNETELTRIRRYIIDNPKNWVEDENN